MIAPRFSDSEAPATLPLPSVDVTLALVREQYLALSKRERTRLQCLLRNAELLDRQLGELRLVLPLIQIEFFGLTSSNIHAAYHPSELLDAIARWDLIT